MDRDSHSAQDLQKTISENQMPFTLAPGDHPKITNDFENLSPNVWELDDFEDPFSVGHPGIIHRSVTSLSILTVALWDPLLMLFSPMQMICIQFWSPSRM